MSFTDIGLSLLELSNDTSRPISTCLLTVVSSNEIDDLSPVRALKSLTKLSASHCGVVVIPDVADLHELAELRLNDNKIVSLPESLQFNYNMKTLELGNNRICKYRCVCVLGEGVGKQHGVAPIAAYGVWSREHMGVFFLSAAGHACGAL